MKQNDFLKRLKIKKDKRPKLVLLGLFFLMFFLNAQNVLGQDKTITGVVVDENNNPLPGVAVLLRNSQTGAQTDFDGLYQIKIPVDGKSTLEFSYLGYNLQSISVGSKTVIDVTMVPDITALGEIVVVGYGTQKKESVVGAIGVATADDIKQQGNVSNMTDALTGLIPGLSVLSTSGLPGGDFESNTKIFSPAEILIRGKTTWNDASPLILVDGVERLMSDVDISEVATVSVLKDASATAVFGVKGGNGVVLITTKRGKVGKSRFNLEAEMSFETPSDQITVAPVPESARARNIGLERIRRFNQGLWDELYFSDEEIGYFRDGTYPYAYQNIDWSDILFNDITNSYRVNATASGGTEKVQYFASTSFNHVGDLLNSQNLGQGYHPSYSYDRFNIRTNFDFQISSTTKLTANFAGMYGVRKTPPSTTREGLFAGPSQYSGDMPILVYEDGVYGSEDARFKASNPFFKLNFNGVQTQPRTTINMDYALTQDLDAITKGLKFTGKLAYDNTFRNVGKRVNESGNTTKEISKDFYLGGGYYDYETETYMYDGVPADMDIWTNYTEPSGGTEGFGFVKEPNTFGSEQVEVNNSDRNLYYELALRYSRSFNDVHNVTAMGMFSRQFRERGSNWPSKREDWVGRVTYNFSSRYFVEANGAYNGSEKFGPGYRFDFFPSVAAGWMVSNEKFLKNTTWLSKLKVRYSYGYVGNDRVNTGSTWPYLTIYDTWDYGASGATYYGYSDGYKEYPRWNEGNPGNPDLRWETALKQNLGFEFAAFRNRLNVNVELFKESREDMLIGANDRRNTVPPLFGKPAPPANIGKAKSHGAEVEVSYRNSINSFNYWVSANWTIARSEVVFRESTELTLPHQRAEGFPIGQTRTPLGLGFINSWDDMYVVTGGPNSSDNSKLLPGDIYLLDFNADGRYDGGFDNVPYGYPTYPQNNYGVSLGGDYKGFEASIRFVGAYNATRRVSPSLFWSDNMFAPDDILDETWSPEYNNSDPSYPALALEVKNYNPRGHYPEFDGSFLRIQSAQIGYSLPKSWLKSMRISRLKIYANGRNLFLWTKMPNDGVGIDNPGKNYPTKKQFNLGVNVGF